MFVWYWNITCNCKLHLPLISPLCGCEKNVCVCVSVCVGVWLCWRGWTTDKTVRSQQAERWWGGGRCVKTKFYWLQVNSIWRRMLSFSQPTPPPHTHTVYIFATLPKWLYVHLLIVMVTSCRKTDGSNRVITKTKRQPNTHVGFKTLRAFQSQCGGRGRKRETL